MSDTVPVTETPPLMVHPRWKLPKPVKRTLIIVFGIYLITLLYFFLRVGVPAESVLLTASRVEVFSLQSQNDIHRPAWYKLSNNRVDGWNIIGQSKSQGFWFARRLSFASHDPFSVISPVSACFQPAVCFRAWQGECDVNIVVCFHCAQMYFEYHNAQGHVSKIAEFPMSPFAAFQLKALAREALPDDLRFNPK